jgi:hypothetical protein
MIDYMRCGGWGMWAILLGGIGFAAYAVTRPREARSGVLLAGCIFVTIMGMVGMASGMEAVAAGVTHTGKFAENGAELIGEGLGELANNGTFAGAVAMALGLAAIVTKPRGALKVAA